MEIPYCRENHLSFQRKPSILTVSLIIIETVIKREHIDTSKGVFKSLPNIWKNVRRRNEDHIAPGRPAVI